jgi:hypothetical protein
MQEQSYLHADARSEAHGELLVILLIHLFHHSPELGAGTLPVDRPVLHRSRVIASILTHESQSIS